MINLIVWMVYGLAVGLISKTIYRYKDSPSGFLSTLVIGVCGSFVGGFINHLLGSGNPMQPSGLIMGVVGGILTCFMYRKFVADKIRREMMK
jgi:uncharacterized membrane protein YeaQ/YmgE (transglycosylase-associated protein family)